MEIKDILALIGVLAAAVFYLYRTIRKKKWCPDVYGSGACSLKEEEKKEK